MNKKIIETEERTIDCSFNKEKDYRSRLTMIDLYRRILRGAKYAQDNFIDAIQRFTGLASDDLQLVQRSAI